VAKPVRTSTFSRRAKRLLPEAEIVRLEQSVAERPDAHPVIAGTGGIRKARWARPGMGKRGGVRAIYYYQTRAGIVYLLDIYAKNEKADLTPADKRELRTIVSLLEVSMKKKTLAAPKRSTAGRRLAGALREVQALEFARRVREIREGLGLSQADFAKVFGLTLRSLQEWEQARRLPDAAVLTYLRVIEKNPEAVRSALRSTAA